MRRPRGRGSRGQPHALEITLDRVARNRGGEATQNHGVHPHDPPRRIPQRAARVPGQEPQVGEDERRTAPRPPDRLPHPPRPHPPPPHPIPHPPAPPPP